MRVLAHQHALAGGVPGDRVALPAGLALDRARLCVAELAALLKPFDRGIHRRVDVHVGVAALPVDRTRRIRRANCRGRVAEAVAVAGLVAERPDGHRDVVAVEDGVALVALDDRVVPLREETEAVLAVARLVRLHIRLGDHVDAVAVAEVVPAVVVGVVAGAHRVDVVQLEEGYVTDHVLHRDGAAVLGIALVAVDALDLDGPAVHQERVADYPLLLEADLLRADVVSLPDDERVEVGVLRRPEPHARDRQRRETAGERADKSAVRVVELRVREVAAGDVQRRGREVGGKRRRDREIPNAVLRFRPQRDVAEDA